MNDRDLSLLSLANYIIGIILKGTPEGYPYHEAATTRKTARFQFFMLSAAGELTF